MDVAQAIDAEAVYVSRSFRAVGTYDANGTYTPGTLTTASARAVLQPVSGAQLRDLPEGLRDDVSLVGWSRTSFALGDGLAYSGRSFRVVHLWSRPVDGFVKFALAEGVAS